MWFGVRFRPLFGLPDLTKFYQILPKTCSERASRWHIRADNGGSLRPILSKRVKSRGSCQSVIGVTSQLRRSLQRRDTEAQRRMGRIGERESSWYRPQSPLYVLVASVVILHALSRPFRRSAGATANQNLRGQSIDSTMVDRQFSKSEKHGMTESKGLTSRAFFPPGERRPDLSGLAGPLKRGAAYLLIPQGLL